MTGQLQDSAETSALLERVADGDDEAFERLLRRHTPSIRKSVQRRLNPHIRSRADASDVVQETRHYALKHFAKFVQNRPVPFRLWLLKTAYQRLKDIEREHLATAKRSVAREVPLPDRSSIALANALIAPTQSPSRQAQQKETAAKVRQCLAQLREQEREILFLRNFEGLSNTETAAILELNPETTKKRCTRALVRLRTLLAEAGIGEGTE